MTHSPLQVCHYIASTAPRADSRGRRCVMCTAHIDEARAAIGHPPLPAPYLPRVAPETPPITPAGIEALDAFAAAAEADGRNLMISPATLRELLAKARQAPTPSSSIKHTVHPDGSDLVVEIGDFTITISHLGFTATQHQKAKDGLVTPSDHYLPLADTAARLVAALRANIADYHSQLDSLREEKIPRMQQQIDSAFAQRDAVIRQRDALQAFKTYVHERLDAAGVPISPEPARTAATGCRIGERLTWVLNRAGLQAGNESCTWTPDENGIHTATCGFTWVFETGDVGENGVKFCPSCGKHVVAAPEPTAALIGRCETCDVTIREGDTYTRWQDGVITCEKHPPTPEEIATAATEGANHD